MKEEAFNTILDDISKEIIHNPSDKVVYHDYYKFRISYLIDSNHNVLFLFITGLTDNFDSIKKEMKKCKKEGSTIVWKEAYICDSVEINKIVDPLYFLVLLLLYYYFQAFKFICSL